MNDHDHDPALLNDLCDLSHLRPDDAATAQAIERARASVLRLGEIAPHVRRKRILSLRNLVSAAAVLVGLMILAQWWSTAADTSGLAFGQVQQQVRKLKTVQYVQTRQTRVKGKLAPSEMRKVLIHGSYQKREEIKITSPGDPLPAGASWSQALDPCITIFNAKTGALIALYPEKHGYVIIREALSVDADNMSVTREEIKPTPKVDLYEQIRHVPADKATKLPDRLIDGKTAVGFQVIEKREASSGIDTFTRTYWVDPHTKLPVRVEATVRSTNPRMSESDFVMRDFVFDAKLDESLFSTDPPEGYKNLAAESGKAGQAKDTQ